MDETDGSSIGGQVPSSRLEPLLLPRLIPEATSLLLVMAFLVSSASYGAVLANLVRASFAVRPEVARPSGAALPALGALTPVDQSVVPGRLQAVQALLVSHPCADKGSITTGSSPLFCAIEVDSFSR